MKIGFFGDSYCAKIEARGFKTYLKKLSSHYNADIIHTGIGGSSIGDVLLKQLPGRSADIYIFVWTDYGRLYNSYIRNINASSAATMLGGVGDAVRGYYKYLLDDQFAKIQYTALLEYIDNHVISKFPSNTKIIHLWSFKGFGDEDYYYRWKNGVEIRPALVEVSGTVESVKLVPNHLATEDQNTLVFDWIRQAIDNYNSGTLITKEIIYEPSTI